MGHRVGELWDKEKRRDCDRALAIFGPVSKNPERESSHELLDWGRRAQSASAGVWRRERRGHTHSSPKELARLLRQLKQDDPPTPTPSPLNIPLLHQACLLDEWQLQFTPHATLILPKMSLQRLSLFCMTTFKRTQTHRPGRDYCIKVPLTLVRPNQGVSQFHRPAVDSLTTASLSLPLCEVDFKKGLKWI